MGRKLREIEVQEISLVDAPSNRKKFYIVKKDDKKKQKAQISIDSDGTVKGTKILVDGEEIKSLADFNFSFYMPRSGEDWRQEPRNVSCSYSKITETEDGFKHTDHFYLSKSLEVNKGMKELKEQLKDYLGEDFSEEEFEKAVKKLDEKVVSALKGALNILNKYKGDFPEELKKAVGVLAKHAGYGYPAKKDLEKAGAKLSKSTLEKIQSAVKALKALNDLLPEESQLKIEKEAVTKDEGLKAEFEKIHKALEKLEKSEGDKGKDKDKDKDKDEDPLKAIQKRIEILEKAKGIKKSIDGDGKSDKGGDKWPSFNLGEE